MEKTTLPDLKQNRTLKTKRWLGWLMFCMMMVFGQISTAQTYCTPVFASGCSDDHIDDFTIPGANFSHLGTGCSVGAYGDYTDMTISFNAGESYSFTTTHGYTSQNVRVWIDFNNDSIFNDDETERVSSTSGGYTTNGTISIPANVSEGTYRMRIATRFSSIPIPCNTSGWGEAHDYTVSIAIPACPTATALSATNLTSTSATLNWVGIGTNYDVEVVTAGTTPSGTPTYTGVNAPFTTTTPLSVSTAYEFYVRANCMADGLSDWAGPFSFMTTQVPATLPYTEDFEGTINWSLVNGTQTNKWVVGSATSNGGSQALYVSNDEGTSNIYSHTASRVFAYRDIAIPATAEMVDFSFDWKAGGESTWDFIRVWVVPTSYVPVAGTELTAANSGGVQIDGYFNLDAEFTTDNYQIPVAAYQGQIVRLVFEWRNDGGGGITNPAGAIDNISIAVTACVNPSELTATDITTTAATLNWEATGSLFDIEIVMAGTTPTGTPSYTGVNKPFTTTNPLSHSTTYEYYVRKDCGDGELSEWAGPFVFATLCAVVDVPYVMPINATTGTDLPLCVSIENLNDDTSFWKSGATTTGIEGRTMRYQYHSSNIANDWMYTQALNLQAGQSYRLVFKHKISSATYPEKLKVAYGSSAESTAMTTELFNQTLTTAPVALEEIDFIPTVTGTYYIGFQAYSAANMNILYVGEISVVLTPTCFPPLNLEVDNITTDSAVVTWEAPDSAMGNTPDDGYEIEIRTAGEPGETEGFVATMSATDLTATLAGLDPGTAYTVYIKTLCTEDTDESIWESISFVTACELPDAPENITFTDITATATKVNYEAPATAPTGYVIFRSTSDVPPVLVNGTTYSTSNFTAVASLTDGDNTYFCVYNGANLEGNATSLTSNTEYYYYVFSRSAENDCFGAPWYSTTALTDSEVTAPATPTAAVVSAHADTSATVSWTASNAGGEVGAITYTLEVYTDSEYENPITGSPFVVGADVSYDLTGLAVSTQYFFRIKANNTYHDSGYLTGNFTTTQVPATLNYEQDFEGTYGWAFTNNDSHENNWYVGNATGNPGSSLYVSKDGGVSNEYNTSGTRVVHAYRDIVVPAGTSEATISFDWKGQGETVSWDYFRVWLVPASYLPTAGTQISSGSDRIQLGGHFNGESDWQQYENAELDLSGFAGSTMRLVFEWRNDSSAGTGDAAAIDNIEIAIPDCSKPLELTVENVTDESADLSWTSIGDTFDIKWGAPGFDVDTEGTLVTDFDNGGTLSALDADTAYEYYVRQDCGVDGTSVWEGPYSFRTAQIPATLDYEQDFEGTHSWTLINGTQTNQWVVGDAVGNTGSSLYISNDDGVTNAYTTSSAASTVQAYRDIQIPEDAEMISFSFDWKSGGESTHDYFRVWVVSTDYNPIPGTQISTANSGGIQIGDLFNLQSDWTNERFEIPVEDYAGQMVRLVFEWRNDGSVGTQPAAAIDNINLSVITCFTPSDIEISAIDKNNATVTWEAPELGNTPEDGYEIEIRTAGTPGETEGFVATVTTDDLSATLSGLDASTSYTIYIKSLCSDDDESIWSAGVTFTTLCDYPDFELVNSEEDLILCGPNAIELEVASDGIVNWYDAADATEPIFTGTTFETDELTETTSFWVESVSEVGGVESVGPVSPSALGGGAYSSLTNQVLYFTVTAHTVIQSVDIFASSTGGSSAIQIKNLSDNSVVGTYDYTITTSSNLTVGQTVVINQDLAPGNYSMGLVNTAVSLYRNSAGAVYPYSVEGIQITGHSFTGYPSYYYYFYNWQIEASCKSPREEVVVTVEPVVPVTAVEVVDITGPTATLEIESAGTLFDIEYGISGFEQGTGTMVTEVTSPYIIEGLTEDAVYDVYVRTSTYCGEWFGPTTFTATAPSAPQIITAEDVTKVYGDAPFTHGSSDSGLALTYVIADETVATFVSGQLVIQGAGETEVTAKQAGNSDYLPAEDVTFMLTVTKADLTVTADDQTKVYDGEVFEDWTVTYDGFVYEDTASDLSGELAYVGDAVTAVDGGEYDIEISGLVAANYEITYVTGTLTITKAELTGITFEDQTVTYDGEEKSIFITGDLPAGVTVTYTGNEQTEVGDYEVTAHIDGGTNFENMDLEALMLIRGVLTDITLDDAEFTYDGTEKTIEVTGDLPDGVTVTYTDNAQTEAGEYEVVANIEGGEFYSDLELTATLTINKATITGITFEDDTFTYDCTEHSLTIDGDLPTGATVSYIGNNQLSLGVHTVTAHIDGGNNYESFELTAEITIEELLPVITAQYACAQLVTADVEANLPLGWETRWYVSQDATDAVQTIESSGTYYVSSINGTCESSRIEVEVVVEDISIPTGETTQQFCDSASIEDIVVNHTTGANLNVYETATGGTALSAGTTLFTGTFYIAEQIGDCESDRLAVQVTITQTPPAIAPATITICGFEVMANVEIGQQPNAELIWYVNETTPQPMNANTQVYSGTYYASQRIGVCESPRTAITFVVNDALPQPTASSQSFCTSAVVSDLVVTGAEGAIFRWFDSATSTDVLADNEPLSNGTYYVSQELNGCESNRKAISVQIINTAAPQIANMSICQGTTIAEVEIPATTGVTFKWYVSPTAITPLSATTVLTNGTYFISSSYNGCESERVVVDIETTPVPNAPTGEAQQSFVYNISINEVTIADLVVNEEDVLWFAHEDDAATLTNPLESDMPLSDGTTYYAVIVSDNGCVSEVLAVTVTVTLSNNKFDRAKLAYYPNPTQGILNIQYAETIERVEIYNTIGQLVGTQDFSSNQITVDMGNLSNGTYLLKLHIDGYQQLIKVVKN